MNCDTIAINEYSHNFDILGMLLDEEKTLNKNFDEVRRNPVFENI